MGDDESVSVKWDHHQPVLLQAIKEIYTKEIFADVRLECDGHEHWVHKFILSACSEYFQEVLVEVPHRGSITVSSYVQHKQLVSLLDFMYLGEVIVPQEELAELVNAAEVLMVRGFAVPCEEAEDDEENNEEEFQDRDIFSKLPEKVPNQSSGHYESSFVDEGGSSYMYDHKVSFKRRLGDNEDSKQGIKERMMMMGQGHQGLPNISVKEEPVDPDYNDRFQYPGNHPNRFQHGMPMQGSQMGRSNANIGMNTRQADVNGGNSNADISNLLNVLIDSNPDSKGPQQTKGNNRQNQGALNQNPMGNEPEVGFVCHQCRKTFHWRSNLTKHMRTHTGEKPYSCNTCSYKTSYSEALKRHMRIHTGEKPYKCEMCDYKGKDYGSLKSHLKKHAPHLNPHNMAQLPPAISSVPAISSIPALPAMSSIQLPSQNIPSQLAPPPQVGIEQRLS